MDPCSCASSIYTETASCASNCRLNHIRLDVAIRMQCQSQLRTAAITLDASNLRNCLNCTNVHLPSYARSLSRYPPPGRGTSAVQSVRVWTTTLLLPGTHCYWPLIYIVIVINEPYQKPLPLLQGMQQPITLSIVAVHLQINLPEAVSVDVDLCPTLCIDAVPRGVAECLAGQLQVSQSGSGRQGKELVHHKEPCMRLPTLGI